MTKNKARKRRHKKIRAKILDKSRVYRLCVFRSKNHIYAQIIDDQKGKTLVSANDLELASVKNQKRKIKQAGKGGTEILSGKVSSSYEAGKLIAEKAKKLKIEKVVFDRGGYKYHGRVKGVAEGAREGGLKF